MKNILKKYLQHPLFKFLLLGLILRFALMFLDFSFDVHTHIAWGKEAIKYGFSGFYERPSREVYSILYPNYPPLPIFYFALGNWIFTLFRDALWQINLLVPAFPSQIITWIENKSFVAAIMKLPTMFADLGVATFVYLFIRRLFPQSSFKKALFGAALVIFNPAFFYTSALWGQIESVPIFFVLLSVYHLLFTRRVVLALVLFTCAILSKQTSVVFVPIIGILAYRFHDKKDILKGFIISLVLFWLAFLPFYEKGNILLFPFVTYLEHILSASGLPFVTNHAFNFWALVTQFTDIQDSKMFGILPYRVWGYILTALVIVPILFKLAKTKEKSTILFGIFLFAASVYFLMTKIHERHFEQALIFLIPLAVTKRKYLYFFIALSVFHFVNLYHNWSIIPVEWLNKGVTSPIVFNVFSLMGLGIITKLLKDYFMKSTRP